MIFLWESELLVMLNLEFQEWEAQIPQVDLWEE